MPKSDGYKNLIPVNKLSKEEARKRSSNGGKKSGKVRQERKQMKEHLLLLLSEGKVQENILISMIKEASENGNVKAAEFIRDTVGEKPTEKQELLTNNLRININRNAMIEQKDI